MSNPETVLEDVGTHRRKSDPEITQDDTDSLTRSSCRGKPAEDFVYKTCRKHIGVYFVQTLGCFILMIAALYNLTNKTDNPALWTSLLSGPLGILLPSPGIKFRKEKNGWQRAPGNP